MQGRTQLWISGLYTHCLQVLCKGSIMSWQIALRRFTSPQSKLTVFPAKKHFAHWDVAALHRSGGGLLNSFSHFQASLSRAKYSSEVAASGKRASEVVSCHDSRSRMPSSSSADLASLAIRLGGAPRWSGKVSRTNGSLVSAGMPSRGTAA